MIALTQEKREELIEDCHDSIGRIERLMNDFPHDAYNLENALIKNKVVLASLTAETIGRVNLGEISDNNEYPDAKVECTHPEADWGNFQDGFLLFTSPLVPEIKFPEIVSRSEIAGDEAARDWFLRGCEWYEKEIKHLN